MADGIDGSDIGLLYNDFFLGGEMTRFVAKHSFDIDLFNVSRFYDTGGTDNFHNNKGHDLYEDTYHLATDGADVLSLYGKGFAYNDSGNMVKGTIEALGYNEWQGPTGSGDPTRRSRVRSGAA